MKKSILFSAVFFLFAAQACKKEGCTDSTASNYDSKAEKDDNSCVYDSDGPQLIIKLKFDSTQERLDNFGQPATVPAENAAQSPDFHTMSAHYFELAPDASTPLGSGAVIYEGEKTTSGGADAVDFDKALVKGQDEVFVEIPLSEINPGTYEWLRVSLTYQNYDIDYDANGYSLTGTMASFVGYNNYITDYTIDNENVTVNNNKLQGYWGFESAGQVIEGQAPGTTVPNPISSSSPVPPGSCVVTGDFETSFTITGDETEDITLIVSLSTNNSFEWEDDDQNGIYNPLDGDTVVDMGLRGLEPIIE